MKTLDKKYVLQNNNRFDVELVHGKGATVYGAGGKRYIDFAAGIGVNSLGFCPDVLINAVREQVGTLQHTSNLFYNAPYARLAELLCTKTNFARTFFANSGAEANEAVIKLIRKYSYDKYGAGRHAILTLANSFHGRTLTAMSATGQPVMHTAFQPMTAGFKFLPANNLPALKAALTEDICGFIVEIVQGEGGVNALDKEYLETARQLCAEKDIIFACDEIQTGIGRTGKLLASEHYCLKPDVVSLAKGLGGGLPIGAVLVSEKLENVFGHGDHGTTFGANPVVCAGARAVLEVIADDRFLSGVVKSAEYIRESLKSLPLSGLGLMVGITLPAGVSSRLVAEDCIKNGLLVLTAKDKLRLLPPLNIAKDEIDAGLKILKGVLGI